ncbi:Alcohol dehydrogenase (EC [Olavius sp. associated proteobacterium Delta 1]|nr:Alcohol dehydrogenase (EC [Olavius sp. associated proteobacterium Delta 1]
MNLLNSFSFELPTRIEYGVGVAQKLTAALRDLNAVNVLIVTDKGIEASGLLSEVTDRLAQDRMKYEVFSDVESNPKDYNVLEGTQLAKQLQADCLVAIGGGSPIDCAKAIAVLATHAGNLREFENEDKVTGDVLPLIAMPTTAGTGSEVTFSSVITDTQQKFKFSIHHTKIAPRIALLDPEMTVTMPPALTAATGMDALTHAIEGFTAKGSEPLADAVALYAIELIAAHLKTVVFDGRNLEARAGMLLGSVLAGISFSHSDVAAVHCIAEALGGKYDAAHGVCNAVVLPAVMEYNMEYCSDKYARIAAALGIICKPAREGARQAVEAVKKLAGEVNIPDFRSLGVKMEDVDELAYNSSINGSNGSNPRPMSKDDYLTLINSMMS